MNLEQIPQQPPVVPPLVNLFIKFIMFTTWLKQIRVGWLASTTSKLFCFPDKEKRGCGDLHLLYELQLHVKKPPCITAYYRKNNLSRGKG